MWNDRDECAGAEESNREVMKLMTKCVPERVIYCGVNIRTQNYKDTLNRCPHKRVG